MFCFFFFFIDTSSTEIYTLSLHDALPIWRLIWASRSWIAPRSRYVRITTYLLRSEEHTSELQSRLHLVCRLLLEKKKTYITQNNALILISSYTSLSYEITFTHY